MDSQDPRQLLALRLRALREDHWPSRRITQQQLAQALGGVSVPLISSWESQTNPRIPPLPRLEAYATLFATPRSFDGDEACLIDPAEMSDAERQAVGEIARELTQLRGAALRASAALVEPGRADQADKVIRSLISGPLRFEDRHDITIVGSQWPADTISNIPYTDIDEPDYVELLTCSELDALFEIHGHLRAANPISGRIHAYWQQQDDAGRLFVPSGYPGRN